MTLKSIESVLRSAIAEEIKLTDYFSRGRVHGLQFALDMLQEHMNGNEAWNAENVALWMKNDERLYSTAMEIIRVHLEGGGDLEDAAEEFCESYQDETTLDGAEFRYNDVLNAMIAIRREQ